MSFTPRYEKTGAITERRGAPMSASYASRFRSTIDGNLESPVKPAYNQPAFNHLDDLTIREVAGLKEKLPFGFEPYYIPVNGIASDRPRSFAPGKSKNIGFIQI